ncbi:cytolysin secretion protein [Vibrio navarrensis]|uniref:cytolysin secretion protein n=1 Tax=Vibrio navarrensis TaxID=29495 RepID=UPI001866F8AE|nr:cytolysin secretion protein [Vibrio navarrensis]MBE3663820.1 cytolysin secretion protein [Vibrio navarrensis]MBE4578619.1 cytolysin secretion protein [Vibrio navarrensis]MBE4598172.1 cytolysin secretion protein [Vibrio navarrensis]
MRKNNNKIAGRILLLSSLFAAQAFADVQILGSESEISQAIAQSYRQPVTLYSGHLSQQDLLYVNAGSASGDELNLAQQHIVRGDTVVLDLTAIAGEEAQFSLSQKLTGLGISAPVVVTGTYQGDALVNAIVSDVTDENGNSLNNPAAELESITQSLQHALDRFGFGGN